MNQKDNKEWEYDMCFSYLYEYNPNLQTYTSCGDNIRLFIKEIIATQLKKERERVLNEYTSFLLANGYCDDDLWCEEPTAIDRFLKL